MNIDLLYPINSHRSWKYFYLQSEVHLIKKDEKVGASEATLLQMLKIFPFSYGLQIQQGEHLCA